MFNKALSHSHDLSSSPILGAKRIVAIAIVVWFALMLYLGQAQAFVAPRGTPPLAVLMALVIPILLFFAAFWTSRSFHELVLTADLRFIAGVQAWRFAGFGFLALLTYGVLPGFFAWPAGLGDIAIGVTAPLIVGALIRRPDFKSSKTFVAWNVFGILDLVNAVSMGAVAPLIFTDLARTAPTGAMAHMPLVLIPGFFVPLFLMLHVASLFQARRAV